VPPVPPNSYLARQNYLGYKHGGRRWQSSGGDRLYTWDWHHGHIEAFNKRGYHLGVLDAITGVTIDEAVKGRRIDV
jgi:hypothetical protein